MPMKKGVIALNSSDFPLLKDGLVIKAKVCCYITWLSIKAQSFNPQLHKFLGFHLTPLGLWLILPVIHILSFTGFFLVAGVCPCQLSGSCQTLTFAVCLKLVQSGYAGSSTGHIQDSAQDVISTMLARGFILGKDVMSKARAFDEKHQLTASATATVSDFDRKTGITEKLSAGTQVVNEQLKAVDQKFQVSEKTRMALAAAEQTVSTAGSVLMKNRYVLTGATWVTGAFAKVSKAAVEVGQKTKEKAAMLSEQEDRRGQSTQFIDEDYDSPFDDSYGHPPTYPASERAADSRYPNLGYDHYAPLPSTYAPTSKPPTAARDSFLWCLETQLGIAGPWERARSLG